MEAVRPERSAAPRLCFLLLLLLLGSSVSPSTAWDLVLLHTNDVHARVEETSVHSGKCSKGSGCFAGVARRATMIRKIRKSESNVLLLDAGDQFQGTVWFNYYKGAEAAHFMNTLQYDAMGHRHVFLCWPEGILRCLQLVHCSCFCTGPHLQFEDEVSSLQLQVNKLQTLGINKIIALGHSGFTVDQEIAKRVRGVDVVIGGHSNTFLYTGAPPSSEVPAGLYPFMVKSDDGRQVPVVQAYAFGKYLGYLKVTFDDAGNVVKSTGNPILLDSSIPQDPEVLLDVEEWKKNLANYSAQVVGKTLVFLNGTTEECRFRECNLGNLICDAMVANNIRSSNDLQWNHVSACIFNGGGIRTSIDEQSRNGSITMEDLISVLPFGGTFDLVQLKGSTLRKSFEHSVRRYGKSTGEFLQVSGFHVEFDLSKPAGNRVRSLSILCTKCRVPHYEPVQDETIYKVVLPSYMVNGGDGFSVIKDETLKHNSGDLDILVVSDYIAERKKVYPSVEGRIKIYNSASGLWGQSAPLALLVLMGLLWSLCCSV
ncbi:5'-nucleotidase-like [Stegastes partitus]|uniref:5'-nucleotidase n=1 Tax=Stegastes partitus TaxID=144197 RepID=A0A9Y4N4H1_9TELE|nr:PREDICTED: 5'-nucleotidase-like [Stegastes partitus]